MTYIVEVVRWEPENNRKNLGEHTFVEKPLVGDHLRIFVDHDTEMVEVLRYLHVATKPDLDKSAPRSSEIMRKVRLLVKTIPDDLYDG